MLYVVSRIAIVHFRSEKIQDQVSQKTPQRKTILARYNRFVETGYLTGVQARVDLMLQMRRQKMYGRPSLLAVHEN